MTTDFACNHEIVAAAHRAWSASVWDYVAGAALSETTLRRNRYALDSYAFLPRVLRDVSQIDLSTTALGQKLSSPIVVQPMGSIGQLTPEGAKAIARGAAKAGALMTLSSVAGQEMEAVAQRAMARRSSSSTFAATWTGSRRISIGRRPPAISG